MSDHDEDAGFDAYLVYDEDAEYESYDEDAEYYNHVKQPRRPGPKLLRYNTDRYQKYDWVQDVNFKAETLNLRAGFKIFDNFKLLSGPVPMGFQIEDTPHNGVRLDDKWLGLVSYLFENKVLHARWPAEFDLQGRIKATRVPLGDPCLVFVEKGQEDVDGVPATKTGCYYAWHRGTQILCGAVGLDADLFRVRPKQKKVVWKGLGFKVNYMANSSSDKASFRMILTEDGYCAQRILYRESKDSKARI